MARKKSQRNLRRRLVAIIALALVALLLVTTMFYYFADSLAEGEEFPRDEYFLEMEFTEDQQALRIRQRLIFHNCSGRRMDAVEFTVAPNVFRRESALFYDNEALTAAFPAGYAPGGVEFHSILADGGETDWGMVGEDEIYLRVYRVMEPGEVCEFSFDFSLLLTENRAFAGYDDTDLRLSSFYPIACVYDDAEQAYLRTTPLSFTRWVYAPRADYEARVKLPRQYAAACTGTAEAEEAEDGSVMWALRGENLQDFAMSISRVWRDSERETDSGVALRVLANVRGASGAVLDILEEAVAACEEWFGPLPGGRLDAVQSGYALGEMDFQGMIWLSEELLSGNRDDLRHALYRGVARQYFGLASRAEPVTDAWLSDVLCEHAAYLLLERARGEDAMLKRLRRDVLPSLQITIPGNLYVTSEASLFGDRPEEYAIVVVDRGVAVLHQLRSAMGPERYIGGLRNFYRMGLEKDVLTEMDFIAALDAAGGSWNDFLVDWIFHLDEYTSNTADWFVGGMN